MNDFEAFTIVKESVERCKIDYSLKSSSRAFIWLCMKTLLGLPAQKVANSITFGDSDGGVDAIYIHDQVGEIYDISVFKCHYLEEFTELNGGFPEQKLDEFTDTMIKIYSSRIEEKMVNTILWKKVNEIRALYKNKYFDFHYYFCFNGKAPPSGITRNLQKKLNYYRMFNYNYLGAKELAKKLI